MGGGGPVPDGGKDRHFNLALLSLRVFKSFTNPKATEGEKL